MPDYIDRDKLVKAIVNTVPATDQEINRTFSAKYLSGKAKRQLEIIDLIMEQPVADVREDVKVKWRKLTEGTIECPACGEIAPYQADYYGYVIEAPQYNFCPFCGAKMEKNDD